MKLDERVQHERETQPSEAKENPHFTWNVAPWLACAACCGTVDDQPDDGRWGLKKSWRSY